MTLRLYNSLTRSLTDFVPVEEGRAKVYTCGPTVYNYQHIGNMRAYVFADTLGRVLRFKGYDLTHIINITDVGHLTSDADAGDDKMEKAASAAGKSAWDIAKFYTDAYRADIERLNIRQPATWSIASNYVPQMIDYAKGIADKHCYELDSGLYFDTSTVADYGRLARAATEDGEGRIDSVDGKRHQADFAIWRKTPAGESRQMEWDSPWGRGAPGWHLECSVMSEALLGLPFDIHTGGIDHREIHHPNEIAQNQAHSGCDHSGAHIWMHNNFLIDRTGKMSKSSGDFLTLQALVDRGYHPLAYRLMCLQAHYRSELEFSWENLGAASRRLQRIVLAARRLRPDTQILAELRANFSCKKAISLTAAAEVRKRAAPQLKEFLDNFDNAVSNDLNTPAALLLLEDLLKNRSMTKRDIVRGVAVMDEVLGFGLLDLTRRQLRSKKMKIEAEISVVNADIDAMVRVRRLLKQAQKYELVDQLRDVLKSWGVEVMDGDRLGWDWKLGDSNV
jgi:cysteinyl-tRNA synthetase